MDNILTSVCHMLGHGQLESIDYNGTRLPRIDYSRKLLMFSWGSKYEGNRFNSKCESTLMGREWASGRADGQQQGSSL